MRWEGELGVLAGDVCQLRGFGRCPGTGRRLVRVVCLFRIGFPEGDNVLTLVGLSV